jgi:hypothetical protein
MTRIANGSASPTVSNRETSEIKQQFEAFKESPAMVGQQLAQVLGALGKGGNVGQRLQLMHLARRALETAKNASSKDHQAMIQNIAAQQRALQAPPPLLTTPDKLDVSDKRRLTQLLGAKDDAMLGKLFSSRAHQDATSLSVLGKIHPKHVRSSQKEALAKKTGTAFFSALQRRLLTSFDARKKTMQGMIADPKATQARWSSRTEAQRRQILRSLGVDKSAAQRLAKGGACTTEKLRGLLRRGVQDLTKARDQVAQLMPGRFAQDCGLLNKFKPVMHQLRQQLGIKSGSFADNAITARLTTGQHERDKAALFAKMAGIVASVITSGVGGGFFTGVLTSAMSSAVTGAPARIAAGNGVDALVTGGQHGLAADKEAQQAKKSLRQAKRSYGVDIAIGGLGSAAGSAAGKLAKAGAKHVLKRASKRGAKTVSDLLRSRGTDAAKKQLASRLETLVSFGVAQSIGLQGKTPKTRTP